MRPFKYRITALSLSAALTVSLLAGSVSAATTELLDEDTAASSARALNTIHVDIPLVPLAEDLGPVANTDSLDKGYITFDNLNPKRLYRVRLDWTNADGVKNGTMLNLPQAHTSACISLTQPGVTDYNVRLLVKNLEGESYTQLWCDTVTVRLRNSLAAALYSTVYADYQNSPEAVALAETILSGRAHDDKILTVLRYISKNIQYNHSLANTVSSTYITDPDRTLRQKTGICLDAASLAAVMLRSQGVPCRVIIGSVKDGGAHAWIEVYMQSGQWVYADPQAEMLATKPTYAKDGHNVWDDYIYKMQF